MGGGMADRVVCPSCGYANTEHRNTCKQCHAPLAEVKEQRQPVVTIRNSDPSQQRPEVQKVAHDVSEVLPTTEEILYIAIQGLTAGIKRDSVVATSHRLIFFRPAMMGRFNFTDHAWQDLKDVKLNQGMMSSELRIETTQGVTDVMGNLDKEQARKVYSISQQKDHEAREFRRQR